MRRVNLSVVVPAYNEAHRIRSTAETIAAFLKRQCDAWEIIVVDDGSCGDTRAALEGLDGVRCLRNETNRGKGYSVRRGMLEARMDVILFTDADLSTPVEDSIALCQAIAEGADIAVGSRVRDPSRTVRRPPLRRLMAFVFRWLVKCLVLRGFHDTQCGFKAFRRGAALAVFGSARLDRWGFDVEVLHIAQKLGFKIAQVPVSYTESRESRLSFFTPLTMIRDLLKIRWSSWCGLYDPQLGRAKEQPDSRGGVE